MDHARHAQAGARYSRAKPQNFIQHGARHCTRAVTYNGFAVETQIAERGIDCVLAHGAISATHAGKHVVAALGQWPQFLKHCHCLC